MVSLMKKIKKKKKRKKEKEQEKETVQVSLCSSHTLRLPCIHIRIALFRNVKDFDTVLYHVQSEIDR